MTKNRRDLLIGLTKQTIIVKSVGVDIKIYENINKRIVSFDNLEDQSTQFVRKREIEKAILACRHSMLTKQKRGGSLTIRTDIPCWETDTGPAVSSILQEFTWRSVRTIPNIPANVLSCI